MVNTVKNKKLFFLNNFWTVHGTIKIRIYSNSWECTYPFKKSKKSTKNCKMFTVKKNWKPIISFYLDNEKRYRKNFNGFGLHKKRSFCFNGGLNIYSKLDSVPTYKTYMLFNLHISTTCGTLLHLWRRWFRKSYVMLHGLRVTSKFDRS